MTQVSSAEEQAALRQASEAFRSRLTNEEQAKLIPIRNAISGAIFWGKLVDSSLMVLSSFVAPAIFLLSKRSPDWIRPYFFEYGFMPREADVLLVPGRTEIRKEYIMLLILKKLCGAMKTRINQRLAELEPLDFRKEGKLFEQIEASLGQSPGAISDSELVGIIEQNLNGGIQPSESSYVSCKHAGPPIVHYYTVKGKDCRAERCRSCQTLLSERVYYDANDDRAPAKSKAKKECVHYACWVDGKEGREAICAHCSIPLDPGGYKWMEAGLEPVGDDPSKDELIILKARSQCAS